MKTRYSTKKSLTTLLITLLLLTAIPSANVLALTSNEIVPTKNGTYTAWGGAYGGVNEGTGAASCINGDYISTATADTRESVFIPLTSIPNGSTITSINVVAQDRRATTDGGTYATFVRLNGVNSEDSVAHTVAGLGASCTGSVDDAFDISDILKVSGTTLEVGVVKLNNILLRVGVLSAVITYTLPSSSGSSAGSGADLASVGTVTWSDPGNALSDDDMYATAVINGAQTHYLETTNFGFAIPSGSTIYGVQATVGRFQDNTADGNDVRDVVVKLIKDGVVSGNNKAALTREWPTTETAAIYGSTSDLWNTFLTADIINSPGFGLVLSVNSANNRTAAVDYVQLTVSYSPPTTTTTVDCVSNPITYGDSTTCTATVTRSAGVNTPDGSVNWITDASGEFTTSPCVLSGADASASCSVTYTPSAVGDGPHLITATYDGSLSFQGSDGNQTLTVDPLELTITGVTADDKVYDGNASATLAGSATLVGVIDPDDVTLSGASVGVFNDKNVGVGKTVTITGFTISGEDTGNYTLTQPSTTASITAKALTVTADDKARNINFSDPTFTFSTSGFVPPDTFNTTPNCDVSDPHDTVGTYPIVCSAGDAGSNYDISYVDGTLTVTDKIILGVGTADQTITYGDADPAFAPVITGFVDGDDASVLDNPPTCSVAGPITHIDSPFVITCSGGSDDKYEFTYTTGTLTVNALSLTVTAETKSKTYGDADPVLTYTFTPALVGSDSFSGELVRASGEDVGAYAITLGSLAVNNNYNLSYVGANLTINKATLTATADDQSKLGNQPDPVFTFSYSAFQNSETADVLNTAPTCGVTGAHTAPGTYSIVCSGGVDNNYAFTYVAGTLTVSPPLEASYTSDAAQDGWILESGEATTKGGMLNALGTVLRIGDDAADRQYRSILSFDVSSLPADAVITKVTLKITYQGKTGTSPFATHKLLTLDLKAGAFGTTSDLEKIDFQSVAALKGAGSVGRAPISTGPNVHAAVLTKAALDKLNAEISLAQVQLRLRFQKDDNDDLSADFLRFYSGNSTVTNTQPVLIIQYYIP